MHQVPELTGTQRLGRQDMELASTSRGPEPFPPCPHQQGALAVPRSVHKGAAWHPVPDFTPYLLESHAQDSPLRSSQYSTTGSMPRFTKENTRPREGKP